jgi:hypothetical protein
VRSMLCDDNARDASSPGAGVSAELSASSISEPRELQAGRQAVVGMKLATSFLLKVSPSPLTSTPRPLTPDLCVFPTEE